MQLFRTFHSVGQGAFYSEEIHDDSGRIFRMVYDCGSLTIKNNKLKAKVKSDLEGKTDVDLLIISHFDEDHINGVAYLKPKRVMIPFLSKDECILFKVWAELNAMSFDMNMALTPEQVFKDSQIIRVFPEDAEIPRFEVLRNHKLDLKNNDSGVLNISNLAEVIIMIDENPLWKYVVCNPSWGKYAKDFKAMVNNAKLNWDSLIYGDYVQRNYDNLKGIYKELNNKNSHSLIVYSGAEYYEDQSWCNSFKSFRRNEWCDCSEGNNCDYCSYRHRFCYDYYMMSKDHVGCVYFGDITVENIWIDIFYEKLHNMGCLDKIYVMQVPHHGAHTSYGNRIAKWDKHGYEIGHVFIISHGETNAFGHPSARVVNLLRNNGKKIVHVTERAASMFSMACQLEIHH